MHLEYSGPIELEKELVLGKFAVCIWKLAFGKRIRAANTKNDFEQIFLGNGLSQVLRGRGCRETRCKENIRLRNRKIFGFESLKF